MRREKKKGTGTMKHTRKTPPTQSGKSGMIKERGGLHTLKKKDVYHTEVHRKGAQGRGGSRTGTSNAPMGVDQEVSS